MSTDNVDDDIQRYNDYLNGMEVVLELIRTGRMGCFGEGCTNLAVKIQGSKAYCDLCGDSDEV